MQVFSLNTVGQSVSFKLENPITKTIRFKDVYDNLAGIGQILKQFRYTKNNSDWSSWELLNKENVSNIQVVPIDSIIFEFKYSLTSVGSITFSEITFERDIEPDDPNQGFVPTTYNVSTNLCGVVNSNSSNESLLTVSTCQSSFNPYLLNEHVGVYKEIVNGINSLFGIDATYIKLDPKRRNDNITFREHSIFGARDPECLKILIPNNEFPDSKPQFNPWGVQFEIPFEIHIVKDHFQTIFGTDSLPQKGDIVYFPMYERLFEVTSTYAHKGFMLMETYWMVSLKKYRHKSNTYMTEETEEMIDELTKGAEEAFGVKIQEENLNLTNPQQFDNNVGTSKQDPTRKEVNKFLISTPVKILNNSTVVAEHAYDLSSIFEISERNTAILYWPPVIFSETDDIAFSTWFKSKEPQYKIYEDSVTIYSVIGNDVIINLSAVRNYQIGSILSIKRDKINMFFGTIKEKISSTSYKIEVPTEILSYLNTKGPWLTRKGFKAKLEFPKQFINGHDGTTGWKIDSIEDKFFIITLNDKQYYFISDDQLKDQWYGIFAGISNTFRQVTLNLFKINENPDSTELINIYSYTHSNVIPENRSIDVNYALLSSNHYQTNLRIFNKIPEIEKQSNILNQNIVKDSQNAILIDNALPLISLPYLGHTK